MGTEHVMFEPCATIKPMEQENFQPEPQLEKEGNIFTNVTPLSKYLAMSLFIALPFIGGWVGYTFAPEKVVEVEKVVVREVEVSQDNVDTNTPEVTDVGITVTSPQSNDLVTLPITVSGSISGNGWFANEGEVGLVEVFDANDKSISNVGILKATSNWLELPTSFEATVGDREMMSYLETDAGYIKLTNKRDREGDPAKELIVPVRFK